VLTNLVQERTVADAQQLGGSLPVPTRLPQGTADGMHLGFVAMAAKREVSARLQACGRCSFDNVRLPRIGACDTLLSTVRALQFGVTHKLTPQNMNFDNMAQGRLSRLVSENALDEMNMEFADLDRLEAVPIDAD
jgi:hypothetical protein